MFSEFYEIDCKKIYTKFCTIYKEKQKWDAIMKKFKQYKIQQLFALFAFYFYDRKGQ